MPVRTDNSAAVFRGQRACAVRITASTNRNSLRDSPQSFAVLEFVFFVAMMLTTDMKNAPYTDTIEMDAAARTASIGGTRQMMHEDEFAALVAVLVDCKAVPRNVMASALHGLADGLIRKARGELETDWMVYPSEAFDRARSLDQLAAQIGSRS